MKINAFVERGSSKSFSCCAEDMIGKCLLVGYGSTAREAIDDIRVSYYEYKEMENGNVPPVEFNIKFDVGSLFNYYNYLNIEGVAKVSGINPSILRQYASGVRKPKESTIKKIEEGLKRISEQLGCIMLCA